MKLLGRISLTQELIIPDSSFFICFLDDIYEPILLKKIMISKELEIIMGEIVIGELEKSSEYHHISSLVESRKVYDYFDYGELLKPFFSEDEILKGEHEVIVISYIHHSKGLFHFLIIDDRQQRRFINRVLSELETYLIGTVGFIMKIGITGLIITKDEAIYLLSSIKKSKFRINHVIVERAIKELSGD